MKQCKSILIDDLQDRYFNTHTEINKNWYVSKPIMSKFWIHRFHVAIRVLIGKSFAVHFKQDEIKKKLTKD